MQKEVISTRQAVFISTLFIFASNILVGSASKVGQDTWIALLLSSVFTIPSILVYSRILDLNPEMNFAQITEKVLGKLFGKIIIALMTWYAITLGSLVVSNFYYYVGITILQDTPHFFVAGIMVAVCIYMAKSGIEVLGKWSVITFTFFMLAVIVTLVLSYNQFEIERLLPVGEHDFGDILNLAFSNFTFPFAESVLFLFLGHTIRKKYSSYKIYFVSCGLGLLSLMLLIFRNTLVLGPEMVSAVYFPSYTAARVINVSTFLTRVEGSISMNYILSGLVKITVCLLASAIGLSNLFGIADYKRIVVPTGIIIFALCMINYPGILEMIRFIQVYEYFAIPFQIVIPGLIWVVSEIQAKKQKKDAIKSQT